MKETSGRILRSFAAALCDAALSALLIALMLSLYDIERSFQLAAGLWAGLLLVQSCANELLSRCGASWLFFVLMQGVFLFFGVREVVSQTVFLPASAGFPIFLGILVGVSMAHGAFASQYPPTSDLLVRFVDALILVVALYLVCVFSMSRAINSPVLLFALLTLLLAIAVTSSLRAGGESDSVIRGTGVGGWLVLAALLVLCLLSTAVLLTLGSGHADSLVKALLLLWRYISRAGHTLMQLLARFFSLFAGKQQQQIRHDPVYNATTLSGLEIKQTGTAPDWVVTLFFALMGALIAAGLIALLWALSRTRMPARTAAQRRRRVTRKSHLLSALRALQRRLADAAAFELAYRFGKRTPQHLLVLAERTCRLKRLAKRPSESGAAFIRRLHAVLLTQGECSTLCVLADALDAVLYGSKDVQLPPDAYRAFAAQIKGVRAPEAQTFKP